MAGDWESVVFLIFPLLACLSNAQNLYPGPSHGNFWSPRSAAATGPSMSVAGARAFRPPFPASYPTHGPQAPASPRPDFTPWYPTIRPTSRPQAPASPPPDFTPWYPTIRPTSRPQAPASPRPDFTPRYPTIRPTSRPQAPASPRPVFTPRYPTIGPTSRPQAPASTRPVFTPRYPTIGPTSRPQAPASPRPVFTPRYPTIRPTSRPQAPASPRPDFTPRYPTIRPTSRPQAPASPRPDFTPRYPTIRPTSRPQAPASPRPDFTPRYPTIRPTSRPQAPASPRPDFTPRYPTIRPTSRPQAPASPRPVKTEVVTPRPVRPDSVKAFCGENSVQVEAQMDLFGIGQVIQPADITLGGCGPTGQDSSAQVLVFETELQGCGSTLTMTEDSLIYAFALMYEPKALGPTPIIKTNEAVVSIQCHYIRLHNVSSNALKPTWIPYRSTMSAEDLLVFSLKLMTDDCHHERSSNVFFLGDVMHIEASVVQANHVPLRVFVDHCVATLDPNMDAVPSYAFIENHGCFTDAKLTGSHSTFLPRVQDDKLHFHLDAFRFSQETRSSIYIFCHLKAAAASAVTDAQNKACSFSAGASRWVAAGGNDQVCDCCDAGCSHRKGRSLEHEAAGQLEGIAVLGPLYVQQGIANDMVPASQSSLLKAEAHRAAGVSPVVVILAGVVAAVGLVCATLLGAVLLRRPLKPMSCY